MTAELWPGVRVVLTDPPPADPDEDTEIDVGTVMEATEYDADPDDVRWLFSTCALVRWDLEGGPSVWVPTRLLTIAGETT